jgi:hypothetical protein
MLTLHSTNVEFRRKTLAIQASPTLTNTEHYNTTRENTAKKQENHLRSDTLLGGSFLRTKADSDHTKIRSHWKLDISTTLLRSYNTSARNNNCNKQTLLQFFFFCYYNLWKITKRKKQQQKQRKIASYNRWKITETRNTTETTTTTTTTTTIIARRIQQTKTTRNRKSIQKKNQQQHQELGKRIRPKKETLITASRTRENIRQKQRQYQKQRTTTP